MREGGKNNWAAFLFVFISSTFWREKNVRAISAKKPTQEGRYRSGLFYFAKRNKTKYIEKDGITRILLVHFKVTLTMILAVIAN